MRSVEGVVKWFNDKKGFGFIIKKNQEEIFVHYRNLYETGRRTLRPNQVVRFKELQTDRGKEAIEVKVIG